MNGEDPRRWTWLTQQPLPPSKAPMLCEACSGPGPEPDGGSIEIHEFYAYGKLVFKACRHLAEKALR